MSDLPGPRPWPWRTLVVVMVGMFVAGASLALSDFTWWVCWLDVVLLGAAVWSTVRTLASVIEEAYWRGVADEARTAAEEAAQATSRIREQADELKADTDALRGEWEV